MEVIIIIIVSALFGWWCRRKSADIRRIKKANAAKIAEHRRAQAMRGKVFQNILELEVDGYDLAKAQ